MSFKNIKIKMKDGKTRLQRVKVLTSGKYKFVKNPGAKKRTGNPRPMKKARKVYKKLAKRRRRRNNKITIPLAPIIGIAAGVAEPLGYIIGGNVSTGMEYLKRNYLGLTGPNNEFKIENLMHGLFPLVMGALIHKYVGGAPLNLNRMLASANVPFVRI